jgi:NAD(P)-dependent dehydrogenase (short-subunit alcohol dehydrogenase family)
MFHSVSLSPVVITGASGALGSAVVTELSTRGHRIAALVSPRGGNAWKSTGAPGSPDLIHPVDLTSPSDWKSALSRVEAELGPPQGAVLIAGAWQGGTPFHAEPDDAVWDAMFKANLETVQRSLRALLPGMVARRLGSIVVIGSRAADKPESGSGASAYTASKAAVVGLAKAVAAEVLEHGVRVNAVLPGTIDTAANRRAMPDADPSKWVSTDSLAQLIAFLLSSGGRDISGAAIPVYARS